MLDEMRASARRRLADLPGGEPGVGDGEAFPAALRGRASLSVIAEVKRARPSRGALAPDADAAAQAREHRDQRASEGQTAERVGLLVARRVHDRDEGRERKQAGAHDHEARNRSAGERQAKSPSKAVLGGFGDTHVGAH